MTNRINHCIQTGIIPTKIDPSKETRRFVVRGGKELAQLAVIITASLGIAYFYKELCSKIYYSRLHGKADKVIALKGSFLIGLSSFASLLLLKMGRMINSISSDLYQKWSIPTAHPGLSLGANEPKEQGFFNFLGGWSFYLWPEPAPQPPKQLEEEQGTAEQTQLLNFPLDILSHIFAQVELKKLIRFRRVCTKARHFVDLDFKWDVALSRDFPGFLNPNVNDTKGTYNNYYRWLYGIEHGIFARIEHAGHQVMCYQGSPAIVNCDKLKRRLASRPQNNSLTIRDLRTNEVLHNRELQQEEVVVPTPYGCEVYSTSDFHELPSNSHCYHTFQFKQEQYIAYVNDDALDTIRIHNLSKNTSTKTLKGPLANSITSMQTDNAFYLVCARSLLSPRCVIDFFDLQHLSSEVSSPADSFITTPFPKTGSLSLFCIAPTKINGIPCLLVTYGSELQVYGIAKKNHIFTIPQIGNSPSKDTRSLIPLRISGKNLVFCGLTDLHQILKGKREMVYSIACWDLDKKEKLWEKEISIHPAKLQLIEKQGYPVLIVSDEFGSLLELDFAYDLPPLSSSSQPDTKPCAAP